jgi:hypothetical protein
MAGPACAVPALPWKTGQDSSCTGAHSRLLLRTQAPEQLPGKPREQPASALRRHDAHGNHAPHELRKRLDQHRPLPRNPARLHCACPHGRRPGLPVRHSSSAGARQEAAHRKAGGRRRSQLWRIGGSCWHDTAESRQVNATAHAMCLRDRFRQGHGELHPGRRLRRSGPRACAPSRCFRHRGNAGAAWCAG